MEVRGWWSSGEDSRRQSAWRPSFTSDNWRRNQRVDKTVGHTWLNQWAGETLQHAYHRVGPLLKCLSIQSQHFLFVLQTYKTTVWRVRISCKISSLRWNINWLMHKCKRSALETILGPRVLSVDALYKLTFTYLLTYTSHTGKWQCYIHTYTYIRKYGTVRHYIPRHHLLAVAWDNKITAKLSEYFTLAVAVVVTVCSGCYYYCHSCYFNLQFRLTRLVGWVAQW